MSTTDVPPPTASPLLDAVTWIQSTLTGSAAVATSILAIATIGALVMQGRAPVRRGAAVVIGCFILFSAASIADALIGLTADQPTPPVANPAPQPSYTPAQPRPEPYDPYAGAAVPNTQATSRIR